MRRREELETLTRAIIEKDARIAQLEKDLAVEKSRTQQLQEFIDIKDGRRSGDDARKTGKRSW